MFQHARQRGPYSPDELLALTAWVKRGDVRYLSLHRPPTPTPERTSLSKAISTLGFFDEPGGHYDLLDAVVGHILVRPIYTRLPRWSSRKAHGDPRFDRFNRNHWRAPRCLLSNIPRHLVTIEWPGQKPGFAGPVAYYLHHISALNRYVVTASEPTREPHRYTDFALGSFPDTLPVVPSVKDIVSRDWRSLFATWFLKRRAEVLRAGVIDAKSADAWAQAAWSTPHHAHWLAKQETPQAPRVKRYPARPPTPRAALAPVISFPSRFPSTPQNTPALESGC